MIRVNHDGDGDSFHQAFVADPEELVLLAKALEPLRRELDATLVCRFFGERSAAHEARMHEKCVLIDATDAAIWKARIAAVLPDVGQWGDWVARRAESPRLSLRLLGWLLVQSLVGRLEALLRIGAPSIIIERQRDELGVALRRATGGAHSTRDDPHFAFFSDAEYVDLDAQSRELMVSGHAQDIVERCIELCLEPLVLSSGLGADVQIELRGTPLLHAVSTAAHWHDPLTKPFFLIGEDARPALTAPLIVGAHASANIAALEARFRAAARQAVDDGAALLWWWNIDC